MNAETSQDEMLAPPPAPNDRLEVVKRRGSEWQRCRSGTRVNPPSSRPDFAIEQLSKNDCSRVKVCSSELEAGFCLGRGLSQQPAKAQFHAVRPVCRGRANSPAMPLPWHRTLRIVLPETALCLRHPGILPVQVGSKPHVARGVDTVCTMQPGPPCTPPLLAHTCTSPRHRPSTLRPAHSGRPLLPQCLHVREPAGEPRAHPPPHPPSTNHP